MKGNNFNQRRKSLSGFSRPSVTELLQSGVLVGPMGAQGGSKTSKEAQQAMRNFQEIGLSDFLHKRPGYLELLRKKLIHDTMTWSTPTTNGHTLEQRNLHSTTVIGDHAYVIGGYSVEGLENPLLVIDKRTMTTKRPAVAGMVPLSLQRFSHTAVAHGNTIFVFGGMSNGDWLNDLWACTTNATSPTPVLQWVKITPGSSKPPASRRADPPCARSNHASVMNGNKMYVFGGRNETCVFNDLHVYHTGEGRWEKLASPADSLPAPRAGHTMVLIDNKLVVFGGYNQKQEPLNDIAVFDCKTEQWIKIASGKIQGTPPCARTGHAAARIHDTKMLVFGGGFWDKVYNDLHIFDLADWSWSRPADTGDLPAPRAGASIAKIDSSRLLVYGGGDALNYFKDIFILDTAFFKASEAGEYPSPRARMLSGSAKKKKRKPRKAIEVQNLEDQAGSIKTSLEGLEQNCESTVNAIQNCISQQLLKSQTDNQMYLQHFMSFLQASTVAHETELRRLSQEIKVFQDGITSQIRLIQNQVNNFVQTSQQTRLRSHSEMSVVSDSMQQPIPEGYPATPTSQKQSPQNAQSAVQVEPAPDLPPHDFPVRAPPPRRNPGGGPPPTQPARVASRPGPWVPVGSGSGNLVPGGPSLPTLPRRRVPTKLVALGPNGHRPSPRAPGPRASPVMGSAGHQAPGPGGGSKPLSRRAARAAAGKLIRKSRKAKAKRIGVSKRKRTPSTSMWGRTQPSSPSAKPPRGQPPVSSSFRGAAQAKPPAKTTAPRPSPKGGQSHRPKSAPMQPRPVPANAPNVSPLTPGAAPSVPAKVAWQKGGPKKLWSTLLNRRAPQPSKTQKKGAAQQQVQDEQSRVRSLTHCSTVSDGDIINSGDVGWGEIPVEAQTFSMLKNPQTRSGLLR